MNDKQNPLTLLAAGYAKTERENADAQEKRNKESGTQGTVQFTDHADRSAESPFLLLTRGYKENAEKGGKANDNK